MLVGASALPVAAVGRKHCNVEALTGVHCDEREAFGLESVSELDDHCGSKRVRSD